MFHDFRFGLVIVTTHLTYHCLKCCFHTKNRIKKYSVFPCEKDIKGIGCKNSGKYSKMKSEIMKHYQKVHIIFFHSKS